MKKILLFIGLIISVFAGAQVGNAFKDFQTADYIISKTGSTYYAKPKPGSAYPLYSNSDAYTVIQAAIDTLQSPTSTNFRGGKIILADSLYTLTDELHIIGWERNSNPYSQLVIQGGGTSTKIFQSTSGKNAIIVKNSANFALKDLQIFCGSSARSCLLADDNGANSEISCYKSVIDNVIFQSGNASYPTVYLKNFFDLNVTNIHVDNSAGDALFFANTSAGTNYGNSHFGFVRANAASTFAGLRITSSNSTGNHFINQLTFDHYECHSGTYGIYSTDFYFSTFMNVDIEGISNPVYFGGGTSVGETRGVKIEHGYLLPSTGGTAITNTVNTGGNSFHVFIDGDATLVPILDQQNFRAPNSYDVVFGTSITPGNISITVPTITPLSYRGFGTFTTNQVLPTNVTTNTQSPGDNSTKIATTAYADAISTLKANLASPTFTGTPLAPTAAGTTNTTQIATTAFVQTKVPITITKGSTAARNALTPSEGDIAIDTTLHAIFVYDGTNWVQL